MYKKLITSTASIALSAIVGLSAVHADERMTKEVDPSWLYGMSGYKVSAPLFTVGETFYNTAGALNSNSAGNFTPVGILDGMGAYRLNKDTVRLIANHELLQFRGSAWELDNGQGGTFSLTGGARLTYYDIDIWSKSIKDAGHAINRVYDSNGDLASDNTFLAEPFATNFCDPSTPGSCVGSQFNGFSRFCSAVLVEPGQFNRYHCDYHKCSKNYGIEDRIYFTNEEDGGGFNSVGGAVWALDVETGDFWQVAGFGRGAWENVTEVDTGTKNKVAFILADDSSPFDADDISGGGDSDKEAAPLYLYIGKKKPHSDDFLSRNGLRDGWLYVFVPNNQNKLTPLEFNTSGKLRGKWVEIDNSQKMSKASEDGSTGYDEYGYPTQRTLWQRAEKVGAFGFSRPEDVAVNPHKGNQVVLASTGVDTYAVNSEGNGADTFGTLYKITTNFHNLKARLKIIYDGDADMSRALRSPDNLDWADDGYIYVQEDKAEDETLTGEPLFGPNAINTNEAGILKVDPHTGEVWRIANIDRDVVLDASIPVWTDAVDMESENGVAIPGEWESSGIIDVSTLFYEEPGSVFLFNVQAHGIEDQEEVNPTSRINDDDLVEGGQLLFLTKVKDCHGDDYYDKECGHDEY